MILLSPPDVSPNCPLLFQHDLEKTLRGKVKEFIETYYPSNSNFSAQFFGKFFKSNIFDTEAVQLENLLAPIPTAVIFSDLTSNELMLHIHVWGIMGGKMSLSSSFEWEEEYEKLIANGKSEKNALREIQTSIVQTHNLLSGFLTDLYFLQVNPLHEPQLFKIDKTFYPSDLTAQLLNQLQELQQMRRAEYEQLLLEKEKIEPIQEQEIIIKTSNVQHIGNFIVEDGIATDSTTNLMWCRFVLGQTWQNGKATGDAKLIDWAQTFEVIQNFNQHGGYAGIFDWRLPTIEELKTLIDKHEGNYIDIDVFSNNINSTWSSTPHNNGSCNAWAMNFNDGHDISVFMGVGCAVRLVR